MHARECTHVLTNIEEFTIMIVLTIKKERRDGRKRLSIDLPTFLHDAIRKEAMRYNCTITRYIMRAVIEKIKRETSNV